MKKLFYTTALLGGLLLSAALVSTRSAQADELGVRGSNKANIVFADLKQSGDQSAAKVDQVRYGRYYNRGYYGGRGYYGNRGYYGGYRNYSRPYYGGYRSYYRPYYGGYGYYPNYGYGGAYYNSPGFSLRFGF
ncbi:MAG: hypothetical protein AB7I37_25220 [Pirellulales bacterium]